MRNRLTVEIYTNRQALTVSFPARWAICEACQGEATTSRHIECDGGGFTASEWAEQDDDFRDDYLNGVYDQPCDTCRGRGSYQIIDEETVSGWRQRILLQAYLSQERDSREIDAMQAAEMRMGA